ncbi:PepSY domain-containing protein [Psychromonas sp. MME1]|uniref:PepSY domain-containing protein n=1 Tax=Psychromonas sp. MME1 TaxID=3231032 RepID=UPI0034E28F11
MKLKSLICGVTIALASFTALADDDALSVLALKNAKFTVEQAIEKVSQEYKGSIVEFEVDDHRGQASYEFEIVNLQSEQKYKLQVSNEDGSILKEKTTNLKSDEKEAVNTLTAAKLNLKSTLTLVRQKYNAEVVEFELKNKKGITFYKFKLYDENGRKRIIVDVETGEMVPVMKK